MFLFYFWESQRLGRGWGEGQAGWDKIPTFTEFFFESSLYISFNVQKYINKDYSGDSWRTFSHVSSFSWGWISTFMPWFVCKKFKPSLSNFCKCVVLKYRHKESSIVCVWLWEVPIGSSPKCNSKSYSYLVFLSQMSIYSSFNFLLDTKVFLLHSFTLAHHCCAFFSQDLFSRVTLDILCKIEQQFFLIFICLISYISSCLPGKHSRRGTRTYPEYQSEF